MDEKNCQIEFLANWNFRTKYLTKESKYRKECLRKLLFLNNRFNRKTAEILRNCQTADGILFSILRTGKPIKTLKQPELFTEREEIQIEWSIYQKQIAQ